MLSQLKIEIINLNLKQQCQLNFYDNNAVNIKIVRELIMLFKEPFAHYIIYQLHKHCLPQIKPRSNISISILGASVDKEYEDARMIPPKTINCRQLKYRKPIVVTSNAEML